MLDIYNLRQSIDSSIFGNCRELQHHGTQDYKAIIPRGSEKEVHLISTWRANSNGHATLTERGKQTRIKEEMCFEESTAYNLSKARRTISGSSFAQHGCRQTYEECGCWWLYRSVSSFLDPSLAELANFYIYLQNYHQLRRCSGLIELLRPFHPLQCRRKCGIRRSVLEQRHRCILSMSVKRRCFTYSVVPILGQLQFVFATAPLLVRQSGLDWTGWTGLLTNSTD